MDGRRLGTRTCGGRTYDLRSLFIQCSVMKRLPIDLPACHGTLYVVLDNCQSFGFGIMASSSGESGEYTC